jgi:four helix bundle protein
MHRRVMAMHYSNTVVWTKAMALAVRSCRLARSVPRDERFTIRPQIVRAATSVVCNIAEGWARESSKEKAQFLSIAQGSLAELNTQFILCVELGWIADDLGEVRALADEVGRMLTALRRRFRAPRSATS